MTWATREQKILEAVLALEEADARHTTTAALAQEVGLTEAEVRRGWKALLDDEYVQTARMAAGSNDLVILIPRLRAKGRRAVGQWPATGFDALIAVLEQRIRDETDPDRRSKLEDGLRGILSMGRDIAVDVLGAAIKHAGGI